MIKKKINMEGIYIVDQKTLYLNLNRSDIIELFNENIIIFDIYQIAKNVLLFKKYKSTIQIILDENLLVVFDKYKREKISNESIIIFHGKYADSRTRRRKAHRILITKSLLTHIEENFNKKINSKYPHHRCIKQVIEENIDVRFYCQGLDYGIDNVFIDPNYSYESIYGKIQDDGIWRL